MDTPEGVNDTQPATRRSQSGGPVIGAAMDIVHIEFFVEPFSEGSPGPHVEAAVAAFNDLGIETEVGPFATTASGDVERAAQAVAVMVRDALQAGATRIALRLERRPETPATPDRA